MFDSNSNANIETASARELAALYEAAKNSAFAYADAFTSGPEGELRAYAKSQTLTHTKICAAAANALKVTIAYTAEDRAARLRCLRDWYEGFGEDDPDLIAMFGQTT